MSKIQSAMQYMKRRANLPTGDHIVELECEKCGTPILCWNDDKMLFDCYPYEKTCTNCKRIAREEYLAINGRRRLM